MTKMMDFSILISFYALFRLLLISNTAKSEPEEHQTYIIHLDHSQKPESFLTHRSWHQSILNSLSSADETERLLYSYSHATHGFSARLTPSGLSEIEKSPAHLATYSESFGKLYTTHTPKFLGLKHESGIWPAASYGEGVIIGVVDTGIWPESESFSDNGMPSIPERWKGKCENGTIFSSSVCNRKLIGARSFSKGLQAAGIKISKKHDFDSPRDFWGHGTHTSSTAAGNRVLGVSHYGYARGTARGIAPAAHVAMYKVFWATDNDESAASDVLAGIDQAIADGVDILSLSIGFDQTPYFKDIVAIASLSAIEKGIFVVCAAGNDGGHNSIHNGAPWIMTTGASSIDRSFTASVTLQNGYSFEGISYFPQSIYITNASLYYGKGNISKAECNHKALDANEVAGKVVLCDNSTKIDIDEQLNEVKRAGAIAGIFLSDTSDLLPEEYTIPGVTLHTASGILVREYATREPRARFEGMRFLETTLRTKPAPQVAYFSSRGLDPISPGVLKPDIVAPGVDVLAAVSPNVPFMTIGNYDLVSDYELWSGTSMATPHVAGVAALLKSVHWDWSPAAIRSALMTTAYSIDNTGSILKDETTGLPATPLDFGAGHIDPNKAMDPGLIYDMEFQDYIEFLCSLGYDQNQLKAVIRQNQWNCSTEHTELNYPSFVAIFTNETVNSFRRNVKNVGEEESEYHANLELPPGMKIRIEPSSLTFTQKYQKQSFVLSVEIDKIAPNVTYGYLKWIDQHNHTVSSPIVAIKP
ncbi:subtilisin-like protease SBT1.8 [Mangifera indica]|uniref:subtilisin-like protease SBT1.8 n=1 Tax=Mangifera indica TaxID=29780 RepID=UPI001CFA4729|nr:subtilisin-like protease SBT1.8 [Mangifera indica]